MKERGGSEWENEDKTELSLKFERGKEKGNSASPLLESAGMPAWVDLLGGGRGAGLELPGEDKGWEPLQ